MRPRQTTPTAWMIVTDDAGLSAAPRLPPGTGVLLLDPVAPALARLARQLAARRGLVLVEEGPRTARRVHNARELREAMLQRTPLIFLSPLHTTSTHPDWKPIPRMRAAALAGLGGRRLLALGGMNRKRYAALGALGFSGWAGISAFRT